MKKTLFVNGHIVPMSKKGLSFSCMGVSGNKIDYLGNAPKDGYTHIVDLEGKFVFPGLCDSHLHLLYSIVLAASSFNICRITKEGILPYDISGIGESLRNYTEKHKNQSLIVVNQYITPAIKEGRMPTKEELDRFCNGKDVVVFSIDGHSCALSPSLLKKLSIESESGVLSGAEYDLFQGNITGYIASNVSLKTLIKGVAAFENECFKYGITKVCALDGEDTEGKKDFQLSLLLFIARRMNIRVRLFPQYMAFEKAQKAFGKMLWRRVGGCSKWEMDGSVGSKSAAFYHPYPGSEEMPLPYYSQEYIDSKVKEALSSGLSVTCHAIGTAAIDRIVGAYRKNERLIPLSGPMCRIDHFEFPGHEAVEFVKSHRLAVTVQPGYAYLDKKYIKSYEKHLRPEDIKNLIPLKSMAESGAVLLGSSDSPVQSVNPYQQMLGMTDYYIEEQSLDAYEALKTYTFNSGLALFENDGCLKPGNSADFFITEKNIVSLHANEIGDVEAIATYIGGKKMVHQKGSVPALFRFLFRKPRKV